PDTPKEDIAADAAGRSKPSRCRRAKSGGKSIALAANRYSLQPYCSLPEKLLILRSAAKSTSLLRRRSCAGIRAIVRWRLRSRLGLRRRFAIRSAHVHSLSRPAAMPFAVHIMHSACGAEVLDLFPLGGSQLHADVEQEIRICLLQRRARAHYLVDLRFDGRTVRLVGVHQRLHFQLGLFQVSPQVDELFAMLEQNVVQFLLLIRGDLQRRRHPGVIPEPSAEPERPLEWRSMRRKSGAHSLPAPGTLGKSSRASD